MDSYLKNLAGELLNLEVNTIIKENTTGAKMPSTKRVALLEIANEYRHLMISYGICQKATGSEPLKAKDGRSKDLLRWQGAGEYSFIEIRKTAQKGREYYESVLPKMQDEKARELLTKRVRLLARVEGQCSGIIGIFKQRRIRHNVVDIPETEQELGLSGTFDISQFGEYDLIPSDKASYMWNNDLTLKDINQVEDLDLTPDNITFIRKAWELGTQQVLLKTVIQIDGDVTNYMTTHFINLPDDIRQIALNIHNESTVEATKQWGGLFKTISDLAGKTFGQLFSKN